MCDVPWLNVLLFRREALITRVWYVRRRDVRSLPWTGKVGYPQRVEVRCRVHRRGLHVGHRGLAAGVPDEGDQGVLEVAPPYPVLLRSHHHWHGCKPWPRHLRLDQRRP